MAIAVHLDFRGGTLDQHDQVVPRMGFTRGGGGAPGLLFRWVTGTSEGLRVTDVWSDRQTSARFAHDQIGPMGQAVGLPGPPEPTFIDVHTHLTAG